MCLSTNMTAPIMAANDIVCYKRMSIDESGKFITPYQIVNVDSDIIEGKKPFIATTLPDINVNGGYIHCYGNAEGYAISKCLLHNDVLFKCIIPKGTSYWISNDGEYAASKIIFQEEVYRNESENDGKLTEGPVYSSPDYFKTEMTTEEILNMEVTKDDINYWKHMFPRRYTAAIEEDGVRLVRVIELDRRSSYEGNNKDGFRTSVILPSFECVVKIAIENPDIKPEEIPYSEINAIIQKMKPFCGDYSIINAVTSNFGNFDTLNQELDEIKEALSRADNLMAEIIKKYSPDTEDPSEACVGC